MSKEVSKPSIQKIQTTEIRRDSVNGFSQSSKLQTESFNGFNSAKPILNTSAPAPVSKPATKK